MTASQDDLHFRLLGNFQGSNSSFCRAGLFVFDFAVAEATAGGTTTGAGTHAHTMGVQLAMVGDVLAGQATACAKAICLVVDGLLGAADHPADERGVAVDLNVKAAVARFEPALTFLRCLVRCPHAIVVGFDLGLGCVHVYCHEGAVADRRDTQTHPGAAAGLLAVVSDFVLQAFDPQIATHLGLDAVGARVGTPKRGVAAGLDAQRARALYAAHPNLGVAVAGLFAVDQPTAALGTELEGEAVLLPAQGKGHPGAGIGTAVVAVDLDAVLGGQQVDVARGREAGVFAGADFGAD